MDDEHGPDDARAAATRQTSTRSGALASSVPTCRCCGDSPRVARRFCMRCGEIQYCPLCARHRSDSADFCRGCGLDLGALKEGPPPVGPRTSIRFVRGRVVFEEQGSASQLKRALQRLEDEKRVDPRRSTGARSLLDALEHIASPEPIRLAVDFRTHRFMPQRRVRWPGSGSISLVRQPWLEASCRLVDATALQLTCILTARTSPTPMEGVLGRFLQVPTERITERIVYTLRQDDAPSLRPGDQERLPVELSRELGYPCEVQVLPEGVTLKFSFGPWFLRHGGAAQRLLTGYELERQMPPDAPARVILAAYRALLTRTDDRVLG